MRCFYVCSAGDPKQNYDEANLERCIKEKAHIMHIDTKQKGPVYDIKAGDIALLKYKNQLVAYGEVIDVNDDETKACPSSWEGWYLFVNVKSWVLFDKSNSKIGTSNYGIQENSELGSGQMSTVKKINNSWAIKKMEEIDSSSILFSNVFQESLMLDIERLLISNFNIVLTGAPGTGKTYTAFKLARQITGVKEDTDPQIKFVQFHPSYDYSDFVEGIKPELLNGQVILSVKNGVFKQFCLDAAKNSHQKYVFIIDEINRADLSRVFGELFFGLEEEYRNKPITTQYAYLQKEKAKEANVTYQEFTIPDNIYIIGTMNDIDRSVESMDFALRRRFAWKEITAQDSEIILDSAKLEKEDLDNAKLRMRSLNTEIAKQLGSTAYQIGGAYFKKLDHYESREDKFELLWVNHLKVVLSEYVRGERDAVNKINAMEQAYKQ